jgi:uncharacterized glyoxalase superfamily protein PhnB
VTTTGTTTATTTGATTTGTAANALRLHTITPYLAVVDAVAAVEFYVAAFGAVRRHEPYIMDDGRVGHAELAFGDSVLMMADEFPELGLRAPVSRGGPSQSLRIEVDDPDDVVARAVAAGATLERPVADSPYGRGGTVVDPSGHRWMVSREPAPTEAVVRPGDIGYTSLWAPDVAATDRFYRAVLGWETDSVRAGAGRQVTNLGSHMGMFGGQERSTLFCCYGVADVDEAVVLVRAAGGTAQEPTDEPHGRTADCVDDQGQAFALYAVDPAAAGPGRDTTGPGELASDTMEVPDTTRARAFYGTVLGWRVLPGRAPGTWNVRVAGRDPRPSVGIAGGRDATIVPMFAVPDVGAAVARARESGGTAGEPEFAGYGTSAQCTDDQGGRFWLVQF